jgi:hypothetical protein
VHDLVVVQLAVRAPDQQPPEPQQVAGLTGGEVVDTGPAVAEVQRGDRRDGRLRLVVAGPPAPVERVEQRRDGAHRPYSRGVVTDAQEAPDQ